MTALHVAAERGDEHLCQKLVEAGAVLDITDEVCFSEVSQKSHISAEWSSKVQPSEGQIEVYNILLYFH